MARRLIRLPVVIERTGLSKSTIYARAAAGAFPKPVNLGNSLSAWVEDEVEGWVEARITERDATQSASTSSPLAA